MPDLSALIQSGAANAWLLASFGGVLNAVGRVGTGVYSDKIGRANAYLLNCLVASACLFLAAFYQMIEVWQWRRWCMPFVWIGMNAITIYLVFNLLPLGPLAERVAGGPVEKSLAPWGEFLLSVLVVALMFALVRFLYQRKIFLRL